MSELKNLFGPEWDDDDPEFQAALKTVRKHSQYHEDHPDQCPHHSIVAPIIDGRGDHPGECLDCHASPVMERETDCPLCYAEEHEEAPHE